MTDKARPASMQTSFDNDAHLVDSNLICDGPWTVGHVRDRNYAGGPGGAEAPIHVGARPNSQYGNCFMIVYSGGKGAVNGSRAAVEATAMYIVNLPAENERLRKELATLRATTPALLATEEATPAASDSLAAKLKDALVADLLKDEDVLDDVFLVYTGYPRERYTRRELAKAIKDETPAGMRQLSGLLNLSLDLVRRNIEQMPAATPAPASDEVLAELEALLAQATPGPWRIVEFKEPAGNYSGAPSLGTDYLIVMDEQGEMWDVEPTEANQKLKVALRNAAPALLARVRQAEAKAAAGPIEREEGGAGEFDWTKWAGAMQANRAQVAIQRLLDAVEFLLPKIPKSRLDGDDLEAAHIAQSYGRDSFNELKKLVDEAAASAPASPTTTKGPGRA